MDTASLLGLIGAIGMVAGGMVMAAGIAPYVDPPSLLIVVGGTFFAVMAKVPMAHFLGSFRAMAKVVRPGRPDPEAMILRMTELSDKARKEGMMALDGAEVPDAFFRMGLQMLVDGADEGKLAQTLRSEIRAMKRRHDEMHEVLRGWVDIAPAIGMIGTLIGLVEMLGNMEDPKAIGPAMAVALLTTLYGTFLANVLFLPVLSKLEGDSAKEASYREMVLEGLRGLARGTAGRVLQETMIANLPPKAKSKLAAA